MKSNRLLLRGKACLLSALAVSALLLSSCAQDGYDDDERWSSSVTNTTLASPAVEDITIEASPDGAQTIISWPVVHGAGGYLCSAYDVSDPQEPVAIDGIENKLIDACTLVITRADDTNYKFVIRTAGNDKLNNKEAETATEVAFTTFTATYGAIPAGDIATWFENNAIPSDATGELCFDLEPGVEYTMSKDIDFGNKQVTLRTASKANPATVKLLASASFITSNGIVLKYIDFDCAASTEPLIKLSKTPDPAMLGATGSGDYYNIMQPVTINGCNIENMRGTLYYDNKVKYCTGVFLITNSVIHFNLDGEGKIYEQSLISAYGGHINNFTIQNSTIYNTGTVSEYYFVRYNNSGRCDRAGYLADNVTYKNSTLYNIAKDKHMGNYDGIAGKSTTYYTVTNCIFVDCSSGQVARRIMGGKTNKDTKPTFANNTYMYDGAFDTTTGYDDSGTNIEVDPGFANAANGDFTVSGSAQISLGTGDPRWLPSNE